MKMEILLPILALAKAAGPPIQQLLPSLRLPVVQASAPCALVLGSTQQLRLVVMYFAGIALWNGATRSLNVLSVVLPYPIQVWFVYIMLTSSALTFNLYNPMYTIGPLRGNA